MPGVNGHWVPLHGARSISSLEPETSTFGWLASTARAGSFCLFCGNGVGGLPTVTCESVVATANPFVARTRAVKTPSGIAKSRVMYFPLHHTSRRIFQVNLTLPGAGWKGGGAASFTNCT